MSRTVCARMDRIYASELAQDASGVMGAQEMRYWFQWLQETAHACSVSAGWWDDELGVPLDRNKAELICLVHSELSEAMEGERGPAQKRIATEGIEWLELLLRKNSDYGCAVWDRPVLCPQAPARHAILVRMSDKIARIASLQGKMAEGGDMEVLGESFDDTIRDLGAYCLLYLSAPGESDATQH